MTVRNSRNRQRVGLSIPLALAITLLGGPISAEPPSGQSTTAGQPVLLGNIPIDAPKAVPLPAIPAPVQRPWLDAARPVAERVRLLLAAMNINEKIALLSGGGYKIEKDQQWQTFVSGIPRLGIPEVTQGDTPEGIMIGGSHVIQMPSVSALGATFSRADALSYGDVMGSEARAMGYGVLHGPNLDVNRDPRHGRAHETFGEDPVLTAQLGTAYVRGVQQHRVIADAKHFVANTVETGRMGLDARIDDRTLREIYLPPFKAAVEDGHVGMIMCAYHKLNGVQSCDHAELLNGLVRKAWGFNGIIRGDGNASHSLESIGGGMDQELPVPLAWGDHLLKAVETGRIPVAAVDSAVEHILTTMMTYGIFDDPPVRTGPDLAADGKVAEAIAARAAVLLKNQGALLPLSTRKLRRIAVIGSAADDRLVAGGPANKAVEGKLTILDGIRDRARGVQVDYVPGVDPVLLNADAPGYGQLPSGALMTADGKSGASAVFYDGQGKVVARRTDPCICVAPELFPFVVAHSRDVPNGTARAVWTANLPVDRAGTYGFDIVSNARAELKIDGTTVTSTQASDQPTRSATELRLKGGTHRIELSYALGDSGKHALGGASLKLGWNPPAGVLDANMAAAVDAARAADVAIVVVRDYETEGLDRASLVLPNHQDRLIEAVSRANPKTIVVLTTGSAVLMPWIDQVPTAIEAWYGGTPGGPALASVLFGDVNPSGRLPFSFPARDADLSTFDPHRFPGDGRMTEFGEGLSTGYRHFAARGGPRPLFPFGYGLSYTTFSYANLALDRTSLSAGSQGMDGSFKGQPGVTVSFTVRNTGLRTGWVTPQIYVEYPTAAGEPSPLLKAFDKVELAPGQSQRVSLELDLQAFAMFDAKRSVWRITPGKYRIRVADSSAGTPMIAAVRVD